MIHQDYRMTRTSNNKKPCLDYPYLGIPDEDEDEILKRIEKHDTEKI